MRDNLVTWSGSKDCVGRCVPPEARRRSPTRMKQDTCGVLLQDCFTHSCWTVWSGVFGVVGSWGCLLGEALRLHLKHWHVGVQESSCALSRYWWVAAVQACWACCVSLLQTPRSCAGLRGDPKCWPYQMNHLG
jgi:hypothetical protein